MNGTNGRDVSGIMHAVRQYALNAHQSDGQGTAQVLEALTMMNVDTERLICQNCTVE